MSDLSKKFQEENILNEETQKDSNFEKISYIQYREQVINDYLNEVGTISKYINDELSAINDKRVIK